MIKTETQNKSIYDALRMKGKNSIFKSVFLTKDVTAEGYPVIEVEPYDETFLKAIQYPNGYDKTIDSIMKKVYKYFGGKSVWLTIYTDRYGHSQHLLSDFYMKNVYKLIK